MLALNLSSPPLPSHRNLGFLTSISSSPDNAVQRRSYSTSNQWEVSAPIFYVAFTLDLIAMRRPQAQLRASI